MLVWLFTKNEINDNTSSLNPSTNMWSQAAVIGFKL